MKVYFVRHGQTNWQALEERGVRGWARSFAPLTPIGRVQIDVVAADYRLQEAEAILCSSYARALESAAVMSRKLNKPMYVEYDLHEWLPQRNPLVDMDEETSRRAYAEFLYYTDPDVPSDERLLDASRYGLDYSLPFESRVVPAASARTWESLEEVRQRALTALKRYAHLSSVVVVSHAVLIASIIGVNRYIEYAEIVPCELDFERYEMGLAPSDAPTLPLQSNREAHYARALLQSDEDSLYYSKSK